jgi:hypothetical protein
MPKSKGNHPFALLFLKVDFHNIFSKKHSKNNTHNIHINRDIFYNQIQNHRK